MCASCRRSSRRQRTHCLPSRCQIIMRIDCQTSRGGLVLGIFNLEFSYVKTSKADLPPVPDSDISAGINTGRMQFPPAEYGFVPGETKARPPTWRDRDPVADVPGPALHSHASHIDINRGGGIGRHFVLGQK